MRGNELVRRLRRLARERGVAFELVTERGKGSHVRVHFGDRRTTLPDLRRELKKGAAGPVARRVGHWPLRRGRRSQPLLHGICRQLGVEVEEL